MLRNRRAREKQRRRQFSIKQITERATFLLPSRLGPRLASRMISFSNVPWPHHNGAGREARKRCKRTMWKRASWACAPDNWRRKRLATTGERLKSARRRAICTCRSCVWHMILGAPSAACARGLLAPVRYARELPSVPHVGLAPPPLGSGRAAAGLQFRHARRRARNADRQRVQA